MSIADDKPEVSRPLEQPRDPLGTTRHWWLTPVCVLGLGSALFAITLRFDKAIIDTLVGIKLPGDIRREWMALQQFGQGTCILLVAAIVWFQSPLYRRSLIRLGLALVAVGIVVTGLKLLVGRPRPRFDDPDTFLGPWGTYLIETTGPDGVKSKVMAHAWDISINERVHLWSFPSSHTAFAVVSAIFLSLLYPRLTWLFAAMALAVAMGRLIFDAHWPTDVIAGAAIAFAIAWPILRPVAAGLPPR